MPRTDPVFADDLSGDLCSWVAALRFEDLPARVIEKVKLILLDSLAVTGGAARASGIIELHQRLARWEPGGTSTALIGKRRMSPPSAALANGSAAHALDYDDIHDEARVHSGCVVVPTLLATAEACGPVDGPDFLLALVVGVELHARLGLACHGALAIGWHPTMVFGGLAASVAAGRLLHLDARMLSDAFGIAFHQSGGSIQSAYDGAMTKRLGAGFAARDAVISAFLAADGLTGTRSTLEGPAGFFNLHARGEVDPDHIMQALGTSWRIDEYSVKPYPGCRCSHAAIGVAADLHAAGIAAESIAAGTIRLSEANWKLVGAPYDAGRDSTVHAQFSAAYSFARALTDGHVGPRSYDRPAISDAAVADLASRLHIVIDPEVDRNAMEPVQVALTLRDGRRIERVSRTIKGSPQVPLGAGEMLGKVQDCLTYGLDAPASAAAQLFDVVQRLEDEADAARALIDHFPASIVSGDR